MPTNDPAFISPQISDRPTRTAVVLTLAMTALPIVTLLVSAAGCSRSTARGSVEQRAESSVMTTARSQ